MKKYIIICLVITLLGTISCHTFRNKNKITGSRKNDLKSGYYIDAVKGSDSNPGTINKPIKTIGALNLRLAKRAGDVYLAAGQVFEGTLQISDFSGQETDPIKINSYGEGKAIINGGNAEAIVIKKSKNIWISDIDIRGNGRNKGNITNGLSISHSGKCIIENVKAEGFQKSGIDLYDCNVIVVKKVVATDNGFSGINVLGSARYLSVNIRIQDCRAENNPGDPSNLTNHSGNGILVGVSDGVTIDHCTATNNGWDMPRKGNGPVGIWAWESSHITIQYCISYRNKTALGAKDGGGFDLDGGVSNSVIQYCLSYENQGAGYGLFQYDGASEWSKNIIRYCVSINDGQTTEGSGSFFIWNGSNNISKMSGCMIYNNTIYNSRAPVISFEKSSSHSDFLFCNNIFYGSDVAIEGINSGSSFLGNDWWSQKSKFMFTSYGNMALWSKETGEEKLRGKFVGMQVDPKLKGPFITSITDPYQLDRLDGYTLLPDSPVRSKGIDLKTLFNINQPIRDFYGNPVPLGTSTEPGIYEMK